MRVLYITFTGRGMLSLYNESLFFRHMASYFLEFTFLLRLVMTSSVSISSFSAHLISGILLYIKMDGEDMFSCLQCGDIFSQYHKIAFDLLFDMFKY